MLYYNSEVKYVLFIVLVSSPQPRYCAKTSVRSTHTHFSYWKSTTRKLVNIDIKVGEGPKVRVTEVEYPIPHSTAIAIITKTSKYCRYLGKQPCFITLDLFYLFFCKTLVILTKSCSLPAFLY